MERVKTLIDHAQQHRAMAGTFRQADIRDLLIKAANFCERIAAEMAIEMARDDEVDAARAVERKAKG